MTKVRITYHRHKYANSTVIDVLVVNVVIKTERARSPCPMYVHKLLACAPLMQATSTKPAAKDGDRAKAFPTPHAKAGICSVLKDP